MAGCPAHGGASSPAASDPDPVDLPAPGPIETPAEARRAPDPPGPRGVPYFGSLAEIRANPMDFYVHVSQRYGGIARFYYGRNATYLVSEPELIKELLVGHRERYIKNRRYKDLQRLIGEGLLLSEGEVWHRQRTSTNPAFRRERIYEQLPAMAELVDRGLDKWQPMAKTGEAFDTEPWFSEILQTLICEFILGPDHRDLTERILEVLRRLMAHWPTPPDTILGGYLPRSPRSLLALHRTLKDLDACFFEAIHRGRELNQQTGVLGQLLQCGDPEHGGFTDRELRDQLVTTYMAGFETSASVVTWLFYRLSLQPRIRSLVVAEVEEVLGGQAPDAVTLDRLSLTRRCIQETMRLYPPAYNFSRIALDDNRIGGFHIPKGAMVIVSPWATHRLASYWPNPEGFDPDRFLPECCAERPAMAYIPFGAGHRVCIGAGLATVQALVTVARFCQRYRLDLEPAHRVQHVAGTVMRPQDGMRMRLSAAGHGG